MNFPHQFRRKKTNHFTSFVNPLCCQDVHRYPSPMLRLLLQIQRLLDPKENVHFSTVKRFVFSMQIEQIFVRNIVYSTNHFRVRLMSSIPTFSCKVLRLKSKNFDRFHSFDLPHLKQVLCHFFPAAKTSSA